MRGLSELISPRPLAISTTLPHVVCVRVAGDLNVAHTLSLAQLCPDVQNRGKLAGLEYNLLMTLTFKMLMVVTDSK